MQPRRWLVSPLVVLTVAASLTGAVAHASAGVAARAPQAVDDSAPAPSARASTVVLEGGSGGYQFAVATNGKGKTVVAWATRLPSNYYDVYRPGGVVQAVLRTAKGRWGRVHTLGRGWGPLVGIDAAGDVTAVWQTRRKGWTDGVRAVRRPAGGRWGAPVELSRMRRAPGYEWPGPDGCECLNYVGAALLRLAVNARGLTAVSWSWGSEWSSANPDYPDRVRVVVRPPGGRWSAPRSLSPRNDSYNQALAVGPGGRVVALFERRGLLLVRERVRGEWTERVTLSSIQRNSWGLAVEVNAGPGGDATVVYQEPVFSCGGRYCAALFAVSRPSGGPWSAPVRVAYERLEHADNILTGRGTGEVTVFWVTPKRSLTQVYVADRPAGGVFGAPELVGPLSEPDRDTDITSTPRSISVNEAGDVLVTTHSWTGWWGSLRKAGTDTWSERFLLVPYGSVNEGRWAVTLTPTGDVVMVYVAHDGLLKGTVVDLP